MAEEIVLNVDDRDEVYKLIRSYREQKYGASDGTLMWASQSKTLPKSGQVATLWDACPRDGNVEIAFYHLKPSGYRIEIKVSKFEKGPHPADAPTVEAYAQELAEAIRPRTTRPATS